MTERSIEAGGACVVSALRHATSTSAAARSAASIANASARRASAARPAAGQRIALAAPATAREARSAGHTIRFSVARALASARTSSAIAAAVGARPVPHPAGAGARRSRISGATITTCVDQVPTPWCATCIACSLQGLAASRTTMDAAASAANAASTVAT